MGSNCCGCTMRDDCDKPARNAFSIADAGGPKEKAEPTESCKCPKCGCDPCKCGEGDSTTQTETQIDTDETKKKPEKDK